MVTKFCCSCSRTLPIENFHKRKKGGREIRQGSCKDCKSQYSKDRYANSKEYRDQRRHRAVAARKEASAYIRAYLEINGCVDCPEKDVRCLDFDHVSGTKYRDVSKMRGGGYSIETIKNEIAKCEVRCANCHRKRTSAQFSWWNRF